MYDTIKEKIQTVEGVRSMWKDELYYAWKWYEEGKFDDINIPDECITELAMWCCMSLS